MSAMLLPHFEICRAITTANAHMQPVESTFTTSECRDIDAFVQSAAKFKSGEISIHSALEDAAKFLTRLTLFERAANKFSKFLDQELFLAYIDDWSAKRDTLKLVEASREYQAATMRLQKLKESIRRAHDIAQTRY
ncbi:hypothetical protein CCR75_005271 [Bremia lactucae]|uniref:Uncharacterized protein n=1 Tax=Bremia lactucae TaxID=4779 RepID=A0A976FKP8_BRELC|nr:hypothetical protein CCR75_005271 [Bremia lactucae]